MYNNIQNESNGRVIYYHDRFFVGNIIDPLVFSACISKPNNSDYKEIDLDISVIGDNGLSFNFDLTDEDQKTEVLQIVSKLVEGLGNLLSVLKKECKDD